MLNFSLIAELNYTIVFNLKVQNYFDYDNHLRKWFTPRSIQSEHLYGPISLFHAFALLYSLSENKPSCRLAYYISP